MSQRANPAAAVVRRSLFAQPAEVSAPSRAAQARPLPSSSPKGGLNSSPARNEVKAVKARGSSRPAPKADAGELGRLKRLGFTTLAECLLSVPKEYKDFTQPQTTIDVAQLGHPGYYVLRVRGMAMFDRSGQETHYPPAAFRLEIHCTDKVGTPVTVTAFGNVWPFLGLDFDEPLHVHGTLGEFRRSLNISSPTLVEPQQRGKVATIYRGKPGQVSGDALAAGVERALERLDEASVLLLAQAGLRPTEFSSTYGVQDPKRFLFALHRPKTLAVGLRARTIARAMAVDTVVRRAAAAKSRPPVASSAIAIDKDFLAGLQADLPYPLTGDQARAVQEIVEDLRSAFPMRRLLSGDVGTGKSVTFMLPVAAAYEAGAEVAILAPSQLVAEQLARELQQHFPGLPVCLVLAGGKIGEGVCVGTTALLSAAKRAKKTFSLVVVDEQHKFSVDQKLALVSRHTNLLEATATAIPRSLALINFGGMDVSILRECPVHKTIDTVLVDDDSMADVHDFISKDILAHGGQLAVIYPLVGGAEDREPGSRAAPKAAPKPPAGGPAADSGKATPKGVEGLESVIGAARQWEKRFPGRVGVLHGQMSPEEKAAVIAAMHAQKLSVLVSSSVIEVGVTLPSLQALLIESPERYGVSQLHQLRGRLARKGGNGTFFLRVGPHVQPDAMERLRLLEQCGDGFALAERDMDLRGFGDVEDDAQSQTGSARTLFHGVGLTHQEIRKAAIKMGLAV